MQTRSTQTLGEQTSNNQKSKDNMLDSQKLDLQTQIRALEKERFECLIHNRFKDFEAMCDSALRYVHTSGTVDNLTALISKLQSGYYDYQTIDYDVVDIIDRQDCVIVTADFYATLLVDSHPRTLQNRALSIWIKHNDQLTLKLYQATAFSNN